RIADAVELVGCRRATLEAFEAGRIGFGHLQVVLRACAELRPGPVPAPGADASPAVREGYLRAVAAEAALVGVRRDWLEAGLLGFAAGRTPGRLRAKAVRLQARLGPGALRERVRRAEAGRGVWVEPGAEGMCSVRAEVHAVDGVAMMDRIQRIAVRLRAVPGEARSMAQLRADVLASLVLGSAEAGRWSGVRAEVMVLLP
ncbi:DUF222 domain-containing protein, partial [Arthrobacter halodurans]